MRAQRVQAAAVLVAAAVVGYVGAAAFSALARPSVPFADELRPR